MLDLHRFEKQIKGIEQCSDKQGNVLLYGSSFFGHWGVIRAREQWKNATNGKLEVINHGFGGATVDELLYYYHRLVTTCNPKAVVFRTGINDAYVHTAQESFILTQQLFHWIKNDYQDIRLIALKVFDYPSAQKEMLTVMHQYNDLLDELTKEDTQLHTVDLNPFFHSEDGSFRDVFLPDGLHLTDAGYEEMAAYLAPRILALL